MEIFSNDLFREILNLILKIFPFVIAGYAIPRFIKIILGSDFEFSDIGVDILTKPDIQEAKEPEKPKETVVKTYVINSSVKMQPVSEVREVPKLCPYCLGVPDNDERCSYCGIKF